MTKSNKDIESLRYYYENMLALLPGHVYWKDGNGILQGCNDILAKFLGLASREEIVGKNDFELAAVAEEATAIRQRDIAVINSKLIRVDEELFTLPDGSQAIYLTQRKPFFSEKGDVIGLIAISFDITAQKQNDQLKKENEIAMEKIKALEAIASIIAHELRTPLRTISSNAYGIHKHLPALLEAYKISQSKNIELPYIDPVYVEALQDSCQMIEDETRFSFNFIEMLLVKFNQDEIRKTEKVCFIANCINEALKRYPFDINEKSLVVWKQEGDFYFNGDELMNY